jgi:gamma-tubulin complex component 4
MIAEVLLVLAGHSSSLFQGLLNLNFVHESLSSHLDQHIDPALVPLLHPGERQCLESLCVIAFRYREIKKTCATLSQSPSRYICALCAALNQILKDEYETLVVETETKILNRDTDFVASGSFVPLSSIRATFSEWDAPLVALESLTKELEAEQEKWKPGPLIDMLMIRSKTGVYRVSSILGRLSKAVQRVWRAQLIAFVIHGSLSTVDPIASTSYAFLDGAVPSCVSVQTRASIAYVGRAIGTVGGAKWHKQLPRSIASEHTAILEGVLPEDQYAFDRAIADVRTNVSEWMWLNVLTRKDAEEAVDSLFVS